MEVPVKSYQCEFRCRRNTDSVFRPVGENSGHAATGESTMEHDAFRFLSTEEYHRLGQAEKLEYLTRAVAALEEHEARWQRLFSRDHNRETRQVS